MSTLKRALTYIRCNLGKSILLILIMLLVAIGTGTQFLYSQGLVQGLRGEYKDIPLLSASVYGERYKETLEDLEPLKNFSKLAGTSTQLSASIKSDQLKPLPRDSDRYDDELSLYLTSADKWSPQLYEGQTFNFPLDSLLTANNGIVISDKMLSANGLQVGQTIDFTLAENDNFIGANEPITVTIVGTYSFTPTEHQLADYDSYANPPEDTEYVQYEDEPESKDDYFAYQYENIYASPNVGDKIRTIALDPSVYYEDLQFYFENFDDAMAFDHYILKTLGPGYGTSIQPYIENSEFNDAFYIVPSLDISILITLAILTVILILLINLILNFRKQELGTLLALGVSRRQLVGQLILEFLILLIPAFIISLPINYKIANALLIANVSYRMEDIGHDVALPFEFSTVIIMLLVAVVIVIVVALVSSNSIRKSEPKKILL